MNEVIGELIKAVRLINGLSQTEFAEKVNVNQSTISRLESGVIESEELAEKCIVQYGITLNDSTTDTNERFKEILNGVLNNEKDKIIKHYEIIKSYKVLSLRDYVYSKFADVFKYTFFDEYSKIDDVVKELDHFTFSFDSVMEIYYHMSKAYQELHKQHHLESNREFEKAFNIMLNIKAEMPILYIIYGFNNVSIRRFAKGYLYLAYASNLLNKDSYAYYTVLKHIGTLHLLDMNFSQAIPPLLKFYSHKEFLSSTYYFKSQLEQFLGLSYLMTDDLYTASLYFTRMIEDSKVEILLDPAFYFMMFISRNNKDKEQYDKYRNLFEATQTYKQELVQEIVHAFFEYDGADIDYFINHFKYFYDNVFKHPHKFILSRTLFSLFGEDIFKKRAYSVYKSIYDCFIKAKFANLDYQL